jgi:lipopolysaccharide/colanic/teichoic acid biosynthesis glycosyltransferase
MRMLIDVVVAVLVLLVGLAVLGIIALMVLVTMGRPILFRQDRPGRRGELFTLFKFRTMTRNPSPEDDSRADLRRTTNPNVDRRKATRAEVAQAPCHDPDPVLQRS